MTGAPGTPGATAAALVVFSDGGGPWWLRGLRPGFRHCFVCVADGGRWIVCDPLLHRTDLCVVDGLDAAELAAWYRTRGMRVVATRRRPVPRRALPPAPFTCVEAVKRILGLRAALALTPWRLYRRLAADDTKKILDIGDK